jgi:hypothetical protein
MANVQGMRELLFTWTFQSLVTLSSSSEDNLTTVMMLPMISMTWVHMKCVMAKSSVLHRLRLIAQMVNVQMPTSLAFYGLSSLLMMKRMILARRAADDWHRFKIWMML